jgi:hypothetical protein
VNRIHNLGNFVFNDYLRAWPIICHARPSVCWPLLEASDLLAVL